MYAYLLNSNKGGQTVCLHFIKVFSLLILHFSVNSVSAANFMPDGQGKVGFFENGDPVIIDNVNMLSKCSLLICRDSAGNCRWAFPTTKPRYITHCNTINW